jgi:heat shock protein HslJ
MMTAWLIASVTLMSSPSSQASEPLSLELLSGTEWVLRKWDVDEAAPAQPEVTLQYEGGRFVGNAGCNRYFAPATSQGEPGDLTVGPAGATRMACPEPAMSIEVRFLKQLAKANKFGFRSGQLALTYAKDEGAGIMLFEGRKPR